MGFFCVLSSLCFSSLILHSPPTVVINEVYYDHPGADGGHEFVELYNAASTAVVLDGVTLRFHNGSGTGWDVLWSGGVRDTIDAGGLFTIGEELVRPPPEVVVGLSLQNGPDAVALFRDGDALDVVGYGGLDDPAHVEGAGADPVAPGRSIARIPDGRDSGDNRVDFVAATPSPARYNLARHDVSVELAPSVLARDVLDRGVGELAVGLFNGGVESIGAGAVQLSVTDSSSAGVSPLVERVNAAAIAPGETERFVVSLALDDGYHWLALRALYARDERAGNDTLTVLRRVGSPPLLVSEVLSSPPPGCPQFVEVYNAGPTPAAFAGYGLRDRSHDPIVVAGAGAVLDPGSFVVFSPDAAALLSCFARFGLSRERVYQVDGTWPTFNRAGGAAADSVVFVDHLGLAVDAVSIPGIPTSAAGRSLERVDLYRGGRATWVLSQDPGGASPGRAGTRTLTSPPPPGSVEAWPNPFYPSEGVLTIAIDAPAGARAVATVFDPRGRRVAALGVATAFPAVLVWNGRDDAGIEALPGLYVLACEISGDGSTRVVKEVIGCGRR